MSPSTTSSSVTTESLVSKYVLFDEDKAAFDVQDKKLQVVGPSPYAFKEQEGPSVLKSYEPKRSKGVFDTKFKYTESTPQIGREYVDVDLVDVLKDEALIHDLAVIIAERGVVFFRNQEALTTAQHKELVHKLGLAAGKPQTSGLHIHPTALAGGVLDGEKIDPEVFLLSSKLDEKFYRKTKSTHNNTATQSFSNTRWHSDITFEPVPADFSSLRIVETPSGTGNVQEHSRPGGGEIGGAGGDTEWVTGYGLAEKISPAFLEFLTGKLGVFSDPQFKVAFDEKNLELYSAPRGAPENVGSDLIAHHPIVRTNPTTGWKTIFGIGYHFKSIEGLNDIESDIVRRYIYDVLVGNPDLHVRFKWNSNDLAIWDNRSTYHTPIFDYISSDGQTISRTGLRTVSVGERPFYDPKSKLRSEALKDRHGSK